MRKKSLLLVFGLVAGVYGANWVEDGGFESDRPLLWRGASLEHQNVHSGKGAVRIDRDEGKADVTARYSRPVELNQKEPEAIMASFWMRFDSPKRTGKPRGGMTFLMELEDGTSLAWYGPFELRSSEMGSWVYREHRWMPKAPVKRIRPAVYLQGCSGSICVDDLYLGPCQELAAPPRSTIPMAVSAKNGRCSDWGQVEFRSLRPNAHVFQLEGGDRSNLELTSEIEVKRSAPVYLTSSWGSQYWTLYSPPRRELVQIYTDERIELSNPGPQTWALRMSGFSNGASKLAASGYVFLTECTKNFLLYPTKGGTSKDWDIAENDLLSRFLGPNGTAAAFSLADLRSYRIAVAAWRGGGTLKIRPTLTDARGQVVPLYALELRAGGDGRSVTLRPEIAFDGVPTGYYLGELRETAARVKVTGTARLSTPSGIKEESIDVDVSPASDEPTSLPVAAKPLPLLGWSVPSYEFSTKISHCAPSLQREVADAKAAGLTKLLVHARTTSETLFRSRFAAPATLTECDVLEAAVAAGKKESVPIYAAYLLGTAQPEDLKAHPDWAMIGRDGEPQDWYCYNNPEVRTFHSSMLVEIVTRYEVAGVALDYVRPGIGCFCPRCSAAFEAKFHKPARQLDPHDVDWATWTRESVTDYVRQLRQAIRTARPDAGMGGYVWARFAPDKDRAGQDWPRWLEEGLMDFVAVGQYTPSTPWFRAECRAIHEIAGQHLKRIFPLIGVGYIQQANPSRQETDAVIRRHLDAAREEGMLGAGFFTFGEIRTHPIFDPRTP